MLVFGRWRIAACGGTQQHDDLVRAAVLDDVRHGLRKRLGRDGEHCMCPACRQGNTHASDCAVHNEPAEPNGACNCGAPPIPLLSADSSESLPAEPGEAVAWQEPENPRHVISAQDKRQQPNNEGEA